MTSRTARYLLLPALALLAGCTTATTPVAKVTRRPHGETVTLTAAHSCDELMTGLRSAYRPLFVLPPKGVTGPGPAVPGGAAAPGARSDAVVPQDNQPTTPDHSETNVAEAGVDEPDLVKTDGRRIVTVSRGVLWVVDAASRQLTGALALDGSATNLLLYQDKVLVFLTSGTAGGEVGAHLLLVDLGTGTPVVSSGYVIDGQLVDARMVGGVVRVVTQSAPRIPLVEGGLDAATPDEWLPRFTVTSDGHPVPGRVDCARVERPAVYTGSSLLTLLTFDLNQPALSNGDPLTIVADGGTVYGTKTSLYVLAREGGTTAVFRFDTSGTGSAHFVASGSVPGYALNEYSVSEWNGDVRVATTIADTTSSVYVLRPAGDLLALVGSVGGLGHGQKIYAVRYDGPVGYVVTFRQTDPLYTLDLSDPAHPRVAGALEIDGYSAYLHPVGPGRLLGVGQTSDPSTGRNHGLAVSLFDVSDLAHPTRLSRFELLGAGHSIAEFNPHAFLYWPASRLAVVPIQRGAVALRVTDATVGQAGRLTPESGQLVRALVIGTTLWTVSTDGLSVADLTTLTAEGWLPF